MARDAIGKPFGCQVVLRCDIRCFGLQSTTRAYLQDLRRSPNLLPALNLMTFEGLTGRYA